MTGLALGLRGMRDLRCFAWFMSAIVYPSRTLLLLSFFQQAFISPGRLDTPSTRHLRASILPSRALYPLWKGNTIEKWCFHGF